jgi:thiol:disulfide interchange protein DsbA
VEYFWYGCPHCYDLEPTMVNYAKTLPKDATFRRVPGILRDSWATDAKIYYTLEVLGLLGKLHQEVFDAIHRDKVNLDDENTLFDWVAKRGVDRKKFADAYNSFAVQSKLLKAKQISRTSGISGVPTVIVDGKYLISVGMAGSPGKFLKALDELVNMARRDRAVGK